MNSNPTGTWNKALDEYCALPKAEQDACTVQCLADFDVWVRTQPMYIPCETHPDVNRQADIDASKPITGWSFLTGTRRFSLKYARCNRCLGDKLETSIRECLVSNGVPPNLLHATIDNWKGDADIIAKVKDFANCKRGFLVLLGDYGIGKSHLACGLMRRYLEYYKLQDDVEVHVCSGNSWMIKQSSLLLALRDTYTDRKAKNPVVQAQSADLLVLDEVGVSAGGRDEAPMIHEILSHRYEQRLPTVMTSNLSWPDFQHAVGERMADRLNECAFAVVSIGGESCRQQMKQGYFGAANLKPRDWEFKV